MVRQNLTSVHVFCCTVHVKVLVTCPWVRFSSTTDGFAIRDSTHSICSGLGARAATRDEAAVTWHIIHGDVLEVSADVLIFSGNVGSD